MQSAASAALTCPHTDIWYACPIEAEKPENINALKDISGLRLAEDPQQSGVSEDIDF